MMAGALGRQLSFLKKLTDLVPNSQIGSHCSPAPPPTWMLAHHLFLTNRRNPYLTVKTLQQRLVKGKEEMEDRFHFDPWVLCRKLETTPTSGILKGLSLSVNKYLSNPSYTPGSMRGPQGHSFLGILGYRGRNEGFRIRSWANKNFIVIVLYAVNLLNDPKEERKVNQ